MFRSNPWMILPWSSSSPRGVSGRPPRNCIAGTPPACWPSSAGIRQRADLEDIHQDIWLRVLDRAPRLFHGGNFRAWLFTIARNRVADWFRERKPVADEERLEETEAREQPVIEILIDQERRAILERCLKLLTPSARELVQRRLAGEGYAELCQQMRIESGEAYKTWHTALGQLSKCVQRRRREHEPGGHDHS